MHGETTFAQNFLPNYADCKNFIKRRFDRRRDVSSERALRLPMETRALMAIKEAIDEVIEEHARLGLPLYALREGKVVAVSARELRKRSKSARTK